jgi:dTDP-4-dehydrorhamnose reductase
LRKRGVLVVGGDSMIGAALADHLGKSGQDVWVTSRRPVVTGARRSRLDLRNIAEEWTCPSDVGVAIVCAGVTRLDACRRDPQGSHRVNVDGIGALTRRLAGRDVFVVYLSTNQVFDGTVPCRPASDAPCPINEYGRQKAFAEAHIAGLGDRGCIVRLTKILDRQVELFAGWIQSLRQGQSIHPFSNMTLAPVPLGSVVTILRLVIDRHLNGIIQVSGDEDISYAQAAAIGAQLIGANPTLIQPVTVPVGDGDERPPQYTSLSTVRLCHDFGVYLPSASRTLADAFRTDSTTPCQS